MNKHFILYIISLFLFGLNGTVASNIALSSYEIVFLRTVLGSLFLVLLYLFTKKSFTFTKHKKDVLFIAFSGIAMGTSWMFLYEAFAQIGVSLASLTYYCGPVIVMVLSPILFKEKLGIEKITGFLIAFLGVFLINAKEDFTAVNVWGIFCGIMSAITYAFMVILNKKAVNIKGLENSVIQMVVAFVTVALFIGVKTGYNMDIQAQDILWILLLGVINTGVGCYLYFSSIGHLSVQTVAIFGYIEPLSSVLLATLFLNERMTIVQIIGAFLILGGAVFAEFYKGKKRKRAEL